MADQQPYSSQTSVSLDADPIVKRTAAAQQAKYQLFDKARAARDVKIRNLSISQRGDVQTFDDTLNKFGAGFPARNGGVVANYDYNNFVYAQMEQDKIRRLQEMRRMATWTEVSDCLDEVCDEAHVRDSETKQYINFELEGDYNAEIKETVKQEFYRFFRMFDYENMGWEYIRQLVIEGELFFENIVSNEMPWHGVLAVLAIPAELISPIYYSTQTGDVKEFQLRLLKNSSTDPVIQSRNGFQQTAQVMGNMRIHNEERIRMNKSQVTYIHSGKWDETRQFRMPHLEIARRAYKQLSLVEDAIVIYRLVRAPERLMFKIDVGNMSPPQAEAYLRNQMNLYWSKKSLDETGRVQNSYNPHSMLDSYWFAKRSGQEGSSVEVLQGGQNLGKIEDLEYFLDKLYRALKIPSTRRAADTPTRDGTEITREELRFAKFIMRIQRQLAQGIKETFITHLKLLGKHENAKSTRDQNSWWQQFDIDEHDLVLTVAAPTNFALMRDQQVFELMASNFEKMANNDLISQTWALRKYLKMSDADIKTNHALLRYDAALQWEIEQIAALGPNWREELKKQADEMMGADGMPGGIGGGLGGGAGAMSGGAALPEFGDMEGPPGEQDDQPDTEE